MIKGSIVGEDGITAEVAPQDDDLADPPQTMAQCLQQAQDATVAAIEDGQILMDVEFPPLAADLMDDPNTSAGDMAGANTRLAIKYAQGIVSRTGKKVAILYPDVPELERAVEQSGSNTPQPGVSLHSLRASIAEAETPQQAFFALFGKGKEMVRRPGSARVPAQGPPVAVLVKGQSRVLSANEAVHFIFTGAALRRQLPGRDLPPVPGALPVFVRYWESI